MHANVKLLEQFYSSFQNLDAPNMIICYHDSIHFSDAAFPKLKGSEAGFMWEMLCNEANNFSLTYNQLKADEHTGSAHWEAKYELPFINTKIDNHIEAEFRFKNGKIIHHIDHWDIADWTRMAMGSVLGNLLGGNVIIHNILRKSFQIKLTQYINSKAKDKQPE